MLLCIIFSQIDKQPHKWDCYAISTSSLKFETRKRGGKKVLNGILLEKSKRYKSKECETFLGRKRVFSLFVLLENVARSIGLIDQEYLLTAPSPRSFLDTLLSDSLTCGFANSLLRSVHFLLSSFSRRESSIKYPTARQRSNPRIE